MARLSLHYYNDWAELPKVWGLDFDQRPTCSGINSNGQNSARVPRSGRDIEAYSFRKFRIHTG